MGIKTKGKLKLQIGAIIVQGLTSSCGLIYLLTDTNDLDTCVKYVFTKQECIVSHLSPNYLVLAGTDFSVDT